MLFLVQKIYHQCMRPALRNDKPDIVVRDFDLVSSKPLFQQGGVKFARGFFELVVGEFRGILAYVSPVRTPVWCPPNREGTTHPMQTGKKRKKRDLYTVVYLHVCAIASNIPSAVSCSTSKILHCSSTPHLMLSRVRVSSVGSGGLYLFLGGRTILRSILGRTILLCVFVLFPFLLFSGKKEKTKGYVVFIMFRKTR